MAREIHEGESLTSQKFSGNGDQSYFGACDLSGSVFTGQWRGVDFVNCRLVGCDFTNADVHAGYWRGNTLTGCRFPVSIGYLHHEPMAEILRAAVPDATKDIKKQSLKIEMQSTLLGFSSQALADAVNVSWIPAYNEVAAKGISLDVAFDVVRKVFGAYPSALARAERLVKETHLGGIRDFKPTALDQVVAWPDGVSVEVTQRMVESLPRLGDRYELARRIEAAAGPGHFCFVYTIVPMNVRVMPSPDTWLSGYQGF